MKKFSIFAAFMAVVMLFTSLSASVSALSWKDGALAGHKFTYAAADEGVASVKVWDKNGSASGTVNKGDTVAVKAGTIVWRDSYLTATAFYVKTNVGYKTAKVLVNGVEGKFFSAAEANVIKAYSTVGKRGTYTLPADAEYDSVFYFCRAGKEAWCKNVSFEIVTEKIVYTFVDAQGSVIGTGKVGEAISLTEEGTWVAGGAQITDGTVLTADMITAGAEGTTITAEKIGYTFVDKDGSVVGTGKLNEAITITAEGRWFLGETEIVSGTVLTADMIAKYADGTTITLRKYTEPKPLVTNVTVTLHTDRSSNAATKTIVIKNAEIASVIDLSTHEATQQFVAQGYKIAGDADYKVTVSKDMTVQLVKATSVSDSGSSREYGVYLRSADENIIRVDFESTSGIKGIDLKINEAVKFGTDLLPTDDNYRVTMSLFVKVAKGYALDTSVLTEAKVYSTDDEGTTYILSFERTGRHDNGANIGKADFVTIDLKTFAK